MNSKVEAASVISAILGIMLCLWWPWAIYKSINKIGLAQLEDGDYIRQYGALYKEYKKSNLQAASFEAYNYGRKFGFAFCIVVLQNLPILQVLMIAVLNVGFYGAIRVYKPYVDEGTIIAREQSSLLMALGSLLMVVFVMFQGTLTE